MSIKLFRVRSHQPRREEVVNGRWEPVPTFCDCNLYPEILLMCEASFGMIGHMWRFLNTRRLGNSPGRSSQSRRDWGYRPNGW